MNFLSKDFNNYCNFYKSSFKNLQLIIFEFVFRAISYAFENNNELFAEKADEIEQKEIKKNNCRLKKSIFRTALNVKEREYCIFVSIYEQKLYIFKNNCVVESFDISTSSAPASCIENSFGTPLGLHCIADKIGDSLDIDTVFVGRKPVGKISDFPKNTQNMITTRIMRLRGLEQGKNLGGNCDTYNRYVYIHGTNKASEIGTRFSKGCIVLAPKDMLRLYDLITEETLVYIAESSLELS